MDHAGHRPDAIDHVHPHATATPAGDAAEIRALTSVFGARLADLPLALTKTLMGHPLGAAAALELVVCVQSLVEQRLHPIPERPLDPALGPLDVVMDRPRPLALRHVLKTSAGFGGHNIAVVLAA
ncbi:MAG: beta-ketoacyl synthase [Myxococcota bacterium]